MKIAGELKSGPADGATLDELLERIKAQLTKLGPLIDLEVMCEPEGSRTEGGLIAGSRTIEHRRLYLPEQ